MFTVRPCFRLLSAARGTVISTTHKLLVLRRGDDGTCLPWLREVRRERRKSSTSRLGLPLSRAASSSHKQAC